MDMDKTEIQDGEISSGPNSALTEDLIQSPLESTRVFQLTSASCTILVISIGANENII